MKPHIIVIIIVLFLILLYPYVKFRTTEIYKYDAVDYKLCDFHTGDLILFKYDAPVCHFPKGELAIHMEIDKFIAESLRYYYYGYDSHIGVVIMVNNTPHVLHMTDDIMYDELSGKLVISETSLVSMEYLMKYHGVLYWYKRIASPDQQQIDSKTISIIEESRNKKIETNLFKVIAYNGFKISTHDEKYACTDLVEEILYKFGVSGGATKQCSFDDIYQLMNGKYTKQPLILKNAWYEYAFM